MNIRGNNGRQGFTLTEVAVASAIFVVAISMAFTGFVYFLRGANLNRYQNELDTEVQTAMERIKADLRLSDLDKMLYYPAGSGPYSGISFPMARDDDGDGAIDMDANGKIIWDRTLVYHVWATAPQQLRLTVFDPRDNTLTEAQRQAQLDSVVVRGGGSGTHNAENAETSVVFENLFYWQLTSRSSTYDGYAPALTRDINSELGSIVLTPGAHTFEFTVKGKNASSSGYKIGLDSMRVAPSPGNREMEDQLPVVAQNGAAATKVELLNGSWDGNHHLYFPATAVGHKFSLSMENDRWEETNFKGLGHNNNETVIDYDTALNPNDFVVRLDGYGYSWYTYEQTAATNLLGAPATSGFADPADSVRGCAVRVLIRGGDMESGGWIQYSGGRSWIWLSGGGINSSQKLVIEDVYIGECVTNTISPDIKAGTLQQLVTWPYNQASFSLIGSSGTWLYDNTGNYPIDHEKSYIVSYKVSAGAGHGHARYWPESMDPAQRGSFLLVNAAAGESSDLAWTSKTNLVVDRRIFGVQSLYTTYPTNGVYTSPIYDTALAAPTYQNIAWDANIPSGSYLGFKIRSGNDQHLADAPAWSNLVARTTQGAIAPGSGRYIQFQALMRPNATGWETPKLEDVTVTWTGVRTLVDIGGTFTRGPDYGIFELQVDGQELKTGVNVDLTIFQDVRGYKGMQQITSSLVTEVVPRNTGR